MSQITYALPQKGIAVIVNDKNLQKTSELIDNKIGRASCRERV